MNLDNVYIADIYSVYATKDLGYGVSDSYSCYLRTRLVLLKKDGYGEYNFIDLKTKQKYKRRDESTKTGDQFVFSQSLIPVYDYIEEKNKKHIFKRTLIKKVAPELSKISIKRRNSNK